MYHDICIIDRHSDTQLFILSYKNHLLGSLNGNYKKIIIYQKISKFNIFIFTKKNLIKSLNLKNNNFLILVK